MGSFGLTMVKRVFLVLDNHVILLDDNHYILLDNFVLGFAAYDVGCDAMKHFPP